MSVDIHRVGNGTFDFGLTNTASYTDNITYAPCLVDTEWKITSDAFGVGNTVHTDSYPAILDTGTNVAILPRTLTDIYFANVTGAVYSDTLATYKFPCSSTLPSLMLSTNDYRFSVPGLLFENGSIDGGTTCISLISPTDTEAIWGTPILESQYIVMDWAKSRIGFANKKVV